MIQDKIQDKILENTGHLQDKLLTMDKQCVDIKGATHQDGNTMLSEHQFIILRCVRAPV